MNKSTSTNSDAFSRLQAQVEELANNTGLTIYVTEPIYDGGTVELWCDEVFDIEGTGLMDTLDVENGEYAFDSDCVLEYLTDLGLVDDNA